MAKKRNPGQARQRQSQRARAEMISKAPTVTGPGLITSETTDGLVSNPGDMNPDPMIEVGLSGLERQHGIVAEEFLPQLKWPKSTPIYKEMRDNDPIVGAILFAIEKLLRQVKWKVEKQGEGTEHDDAAEFLEQCMQDMSMTWEDVIAEAASMFPFGWSWLETVYKVRRGDQGEGGDTSKFNDNRIGWRKLPLRAQETLHRWVFDESGGVIGFIQRPAPSYEEIFIPLEKSLLFRTSVHKNNPEGRSILRNAYRPWYFKKRIEEIEAVGIERDLAGLPVMWLDPRYMAEDAPPAMKAAYREYQKIVSNVRRDRQEGIIFPNIKDQAGNRLIEFELMSSSGARAFATDPVIARYERNIAMTVLADWLMLGHGQTGSWALSSDKTSLFSVALGAWLDAIAATFNDYAIPRLFRLNGMSTDPLPKIAYGDIEKPDLTALGTFLAALSTAGVPLMPNDNLVRALFDAASLPPPTEEDLSRQTEAALAAQAAVERDAAEKELQRRSKEQEDIDALTE